MEQEQTLIQDYLKVAHDDQATYIHEAIADKYNINIADWYSFENDPNRLTFLNERLRVQIPDEQEAWTSLEHDPTRYLILSYINTTLNIDIRLLVLLEDTEVTELQNIIQNDEARVRYHQLHSAAVIYAGIKNKTLHDIWNKVHHLQGITQQAFIEEVNRLHYQTYGPLEFEEEEHETTWDRLKAKTKRLANGTKKFFKKKIAVQTALLGSIGASMLGIGIGVQQFMEHNKPIHRKIPMTATTTKQNISPYPKPQPGPHPKLTQLPTLHETTGQNLYDNGTKERHPSAQQSLPQENLHLFRQHLHDWGISSHEFEIFLMREMKMGHSPSEIRDSFFTVTIPKGGSISMEMAKKIARVKNQSLASYLWSEEGIAMIDKHFKKNTKGHYPLSSIKDLVMPGEKISLY